MSLPSRLRHPVPWRSVGGVVGAVAGAIAAFFLLGAVGLYNLAFIFQHLSSGVGPADTSLELTSISFAIGFVLALPLGIVRAFPPRRQTRRPTRDLRSSRQGSVGTAIRLAARWAVYGVVSGYVQAVRGTPFLVQVFLVYYAIIFAFPRFNALGLNVSFWAGLLALTINTTGYQAEAMRGGFQSVDASQVEAARALGLSRVRTFMRITLPQGLRLVLLPLTNEWISNFKTSAILSYIAVVELFFWARTDIAYQLARPVEAFVMLAIFYLVINATLSRTVTALETRYRIPGLGTPLSDLAARSG